MLRPRPELLALILGACVLPAGGAGGVEVLWSLREQNGVDGDGARRLRTCAGAGVDEVHLALRDAADPARSSSQRFPCPAGNPPPEARARETPEIFLDLRAGRYELGVDALDGAGEALAAVDEVLDLGRHAVVLVDPELARPLQPLTIQLGGGCERIALALRYADPERDLHPDGQPVPALYRQALRSDRGLPLDGSERPCPDPLGAHRVDDLDPGAYLLELRVDGRTCPIPLHVGDSPAHLAVDLENPGCDG